MPQHLIFPDSHAAADALTFAGRTALVGDGVVRLCAAEGTLAMSSAVLSSRGLFDSTPTVLALRASSVDPELVCDVVVTASDLLVGEDDRTVVLPEVGKSAPWAGISPPRSGWVHRGTIAASTLAARAQWGITAVTQALPQSPGEDALRAVRAMVWGAPDDALHDVPLGAAFAAFTLGFIGGEEDAQVRTCGVWTRVTLARGHIIVRAPGRSGLTEVRATGAA